MRAALARGFANELAHKQENFGIPFRPVILHNLLVFFNEVLVEIAFMLSPSLNFLSKASCIDPFLQGCIELLVLQPYLVLGILDAS